MNVEIISIDEEKIKASHYEYELVFNTARIYERPKTICGTLYKDDEEMTIDVGSIYWGLLIKDLVRLCMDLQNPHETQQSIP